MSQSLQIEPDAASSIAPVVPSKCRRSGVRQWVARPSRPRWFLRYLMVVRIHSLLGALGRRYSSRAALGLASQADDHDRRRVPVRWHASRSTGIYRLGSALLHELGGPPHREIPVGLIVDARSGPHGG